MATSSGLSWGSHVSGAALAAVIADDQEPVASAIPLSDFIADLNDHGRCVKGRAAIAAAS
jgi:hypothetical protein